MKNSSLLLVHFFVHVGISIIILIIAETVGIWFLNNKMVIPSDRMSAANWIYQFSLLSFVITILTSPYNALIIARENMKVYAYTSIIEVLLKLFIVYILVFFSVDKLKLYAVLTFLVSMIVCSIYRIICKKKYMETRLEFKWDKELFKSIFSYSSWTLFGTLAGASNNQGINILLNMFFGPLANAAYSVGRQVGTVVQSFSSNFFTAVRPAIIKSYAEKEYVYMWKLFYLSSKFQFFLLFIIVLPLILQIEDILELWLGTVGEYMISFAQLILINAMLICMSDPITVIVQAAKNVKIYHGVVDGFTLISLPLIYFFFKFNYPPEVAFYVSIIVFAIAHILRIWILKRTVTFSIADYIKLFILPSVLIILLSVIPMIFVLDLFMPGITKILIITVLSILIISFWAYILGLTKEEKSMFLSLVIKK
ncbi:MAG: oligosaccharide flippase family protein [Bacteroides sp.]|nr:oligosaccharide flippase family protein [Bacteroides sp.]